MNEPILLRIDAPQDRELRTPVCRLQGWCGCADLSEIAGFELRIGDARVPWSPHARPDVAAAYPDLSILGFAVDLDLSQYLYAVGPDSQLVLTAVFPRAPQMKVRLTVASGVTAGCLAAATGL
jgi:hypothetical protein